MESNIFYSVGDFYQAWQGFHSSYTSYVILTDENVDKLVLPELLRQLPEFAKIKIFVVPSGERNKSLKNLSAIWTFLQKVGADRNSLLINLGGGVIGDMGGFAASTYMRGIDFIQIPTTLLSMIDASVGGKTAINYNGAKNLIGTFQKPKMVWIYSGFLKTLPKSQWLSGLGELFKMAIIEGGELWEKINNVQIIEQDKIAQLIPLAVEAKNKIVTQDFKEMGLRKALNLGHSLGHAFESFGLQSNGMKLTHGQAVAFGIYFETQISLKMNRIDEESASVIMNQCKLWFGEIPSYKNHVKEICTWLKIDKKNKAHNLIMSLPEGVGKVAINVAVEMDLVKEVLNLS